MAHAIFVAAVLLLCGCALVAASGNPSPKQMAVPCYMKYYNGFCYVEKKAETCTFYSSPSYATYAECAGDTKMGKHVKCADASAELKALDVYKACTDKEVLGRGGGSGGAGAGQPPAANWWQMSNKDVAGKDIASGGKSYTEVCKGLDEVKAACARTSGCAGFTFDGRCGFLKTLTTDNKDRQGWTLYVKG